MEQPGSIKVAIDFESRTVTVIITQPGITTSVSLDPFGAAEFVQSMDKAVSMLTSTTVIPDRRN